MKVLITGASGLVGSRFVELYSDKYDLLTPSSDELNITDLNLVKQYIQKHNPEVIINFAAFTNVSEAEKQRGDESGLCWQANVEGVRNLLAVLPTCRFIQISTDYVFSALSEDPGPYSEDHKPETDSKKLTWYGYTKAEAERLIGNKGTIVRIIYPVRSLYPLKLDYIRKTIQIFDQGKLYPIFTDQQVSIAFIDEVCQAINKIIELNTNGLFHVSSTDTASPFDIYSYVLEKVRGAKNVLKPGSLNEFLKTVDSPVRYPRFGGLKTEDTQLKLKLQLSTWKQIVDKLVEQGISA